MLSKTYPEKIRCELQLLLDHLNSADEMVSDRLCAWFHEAVTTVSLNSVLRPIRWIQPVEHFSFPNVSKAAHLDDCSGLTAFSFRCLRWDGSVGLFVNVDGFHSITEYNWTSSLAVSLFFCLFYLWKYKISRERKTLCLDEAFEPFSSTLFRSEAVEHH